MRILTETVTEDSEPIVVVTDTTEDVTAVVVETVPNEDQPSEVKPDPEDMSLRVMVDIGADFPVHAHAVNEFDAQPRALLRIAPQVPRVSAKQVKETACASMGLKSEGLLLVVAGAPRADSYTFSPHGLKSLLLGEATRRRTRER